MPMAPEQALNDISALNTREISRTRADGAQNAPISFTVRSRTETVMMPIIMLDTTSEIATKCDKHAS